jgi:DHA1 family bicyclomycin/chloramphenicol resistance-like MFS transporter
VPAEHFGFLFGLNIVSMMAWAALNARLVVGRGARGMMRIGVIQLAIGVGLLAVSGATGAFGLIGIIVPLFIYTSSLNPVAANALARASEPFPRRGVRPPRCSAPCSSFSVPLPGLRLGSSMMARRFQ